MVSTTSVVRLSLNSLIATIGVLLGASIQFVASSTGDLTALFGALALAIAAGTAAEILCQPSRADGARAEANAARGGTRCSTERLARHDALTGLLNRHAFYARLENCIQGGRRADRRTAVLSLDLIDFKSINMRLGSAAGAVTRARAWRPPCARRMRSRAWAPTNSR